MLLIAFHRDLSQHPTISEVACGRLKLLSTELVTTWFAASNQTLFQVQEENKQLVLIMKYDGHWLSFHTKCYFTGNQLSALDSCTPEGAVYDRAYDAAILANFIPAIEKVLTGPYHKITD